MKKTKQTKDIKNKKTSNNLNIQKLEDAADLLRSIAHPLRVGIIELLEGSNQMTVTQIYEKLEIEQPTASHHLNILKSKGVLMSVRKGRQILYSLKLDKLSDILSCVNKCGQ